MLKNLSILTVIKKIRSGVTIGLYVMAFIKAFNVLADELEKINPDKSDKKIENE